MSAPITPANNAACGNNQSSHSGPFIDHLSFLRSIVTAAYPYPRLQLGPRLSPTNIARVSDLSTAFRIRSVGRPTRGVFVGVCRPSICVDAS